MTKYLKMNKANWIKLCKGTIQYEQQSMKLEDKKQIKFNLERKEEK